MMRMVISGLSTGTNGMGTLMYDIATMVAVPWPYIAELQRSTHSRTMATAIKGITD